MLSEGDVESWNQLFPDCQINKTNLRNPTEQFVINALVCYLRRFGYQIEPPFELDSEAKENNKEIRLFLIKLTRQIDHFLKITDKSYSFTYYDLIRPTPKKTAHMLYILLNYYYYYNLYKEDVFNMAGEKVRKLEDLRERINKTKYDNDNKKVENKNIQSMIEKLEEDVSKARTTFEELDKKRSCQEEEFEKVKNSYGELNEKLNHLEEQRKHLRKQVVSKNEYQELQNQMQQLKVELAEYKQKELTIAGNLNDCKKRNENLIKLSKEVEEAKEIIPLNRIQLLQKTIKQLAQSKKDEHDLELKQSSLLQQIEEENAKNISLKNEQQIKKLEFQSKRDERMKEFETKQNILKQKEADILHLEAEEHISECKLEEQKNIAQYLQENISEILNGYED